MVLPVDHDDLMLPPGGSFPYYREGFRLGVTPETTAGAGHVIGGPSSWDGTLEDNLLFSDGTGFTDIAASPYFNHNFPSSSSNLNHNYQGDGLPSEMSNHFTTNGQGIPNEDHLHRSATSSQFPFSPYTEHTALSPSARTEQDFTPRQQIYELPASPLTGSSHCTPMMTTRVVPLHTIFPTADTTTTSTTPDPEIIGPPSFPDITDEKCPKNSGILRDFLLSGIDESSVVQYFRKRAKDKVSTLKSRNASMFRRRGPAKFECPMEDCDADFTRKHNLKNHLKSHVGLTDEICMYCGKGFTTVPVCKRHKRTCKLNPKNI